MRIIHLQRRSALVGGHAPKLANARSFQLEFLKLKTFCKPANFYFNCKIVNLI